MKLCVFCGERAAVLIDAEGFPACEHCNGLREVPLEMLESPELAQLTVN